MKSFGLLLLLSTPQVVAKLGRSHIQQQQQQQGNDDHQRELMALQFHGSNPNFKLGRCEGDCDSNDDCQEGLVCFQRYNAFEAVPACSGGANDPSLSDYCVRPTDRHTVDDPTPPPVPPPTPAPFDPTPKIDPYAGESSHTLSAVPIKWSTNFPLALCEGDCDSDFDCQGGLICFQRGGKEAVPGCIGAEHDWSMTDYCAPRPGTNPGQPQTGDLPIAWSGIFPLKRCEGDCDSDIDCEGSLKCFQKNAFAAVPGCIGGENDSSNVDYCFDDGVRQGPPAPVPQTNPPVPVNNGRTATYVGDRDFSGNKLSDCQGDCDTDSDCQPNSFCWQRNEGESMPYCAGAQGAIDYCIPKSESPGKKLRLYWDNYFWQETTQEYFWCMTCTKCETLTTGDGWEGNCKDPPSGQCQEGDLIWIHNCKDVRKRFDIIQNPGSGDQIQVHGTNLCFSNRENRWLELRPCNKNISNQLWTPMTNRGKFEIRPYFQRNFSTKDALCISQLHHPKSTEVLALRECWLNIHYETNYWMEWY